MDRSIAEQIADALNSIAVSQKRIALAVEDVVADRHASYQRQPCDGCGCTIVPTGVAYCPACRRPQS